jgi:hypothetical protein
MIIQRFKTEQKIILNAETVREIGNIIFNEYLNEYKGTVAC